MTKMSGLFLAVLMAAAVVNGQVAQGDEFWAKRAEGHKGGHAMAAPIDGAIAAYQRAIAANPNDLEARWKLLRALRFKGAYVAGTSDEKKKVFADAKTAGQGAMTVVDRALGAKGPVAKASEKQLAEALRAIPNATEVVYWDAVNWGEWALVYGKMAAVREGAADRIKRQSEIVMMSDPKLETGGGARVLGRLHNQTPRVPFVTGWASDELAVKYLSQSLQADPTNKLTRVFLAEAMVSNNSGTKPQAIQMLKDVLATPPDGDWAVEQAEAQERAQELMKAWGAK